MLRQQNPLHNPMDFLAGDGEMATRIRNKDWSKHPFGQPSEWPHSLRAALSICLNSAFPNAIYWGPDLRLLYNDAWSNILGPRHPDALGAPASEVWSDIWSVIEPQFMNLIRTGEGLFVQDQMLPMRRYGYEEETYWNYSFTPLRGEDGAIMGIHNSGTETTESVIRNRNAQFHIALNEALRDCSSAQQAMELALNMLGPHLNASRVGLRERSAGDPEGMFPAHLEWDDDGVGTYAAVLGLQSFGAHAREELRSGQAVQFCVNDPALEPESRAFLDRAGICSALEVPRLENGQVTAILYVHSMTPRRFSDMDIAAIAKVLDLVMSWVERERTRDRENVMAREIDHRAKNLLSVVQAVVRMTDGDTVAEYRENLMDRIAALSQAHVLLSRKRWTDLTLRDLVMEELAPYSDRVDSDILVRGPHVPLQPADAQLIGMLVHELATNSIKYGALGTPDGRLSVIWDHDAASGLDLTWEESFCSKAAPQPGGASSGGGYGSQLLTRVVQEHLDGTISRTPTDGGMRYEISIPMSGEASAPLQSSGQAGDGARSVMIVEDEVIVALDLADMLREAGFEIFGAFRSVAQAQQALENGLPHLAVLDSNLGNETSDPIRRFLASQKVPYVMVSGYDADLAEIEGSHATPRLSKPVSRKELLRTLENLDHPPSASAAE